MKVMSDAELRARYTEILDAVVNDREEVVITRAGHQPVVILALSEYDSLRETVYLLSNPANAHRLLDSIERLEVGSVSEGTLEPREGVWRRPVSP